MCPQVNGAERAGRSLWGAVADDERVFQETTGGFFTEGRSDFTEVKLKRPFRGSALSLMRDNGQGRSLKGIQKVTGA